MRSEASGQSQPHGILAQPLKVLFGAKRNIVSVQSATTTSMPRQVAQRCVETIVLKLLSRGMERGIQENASHTAARALQVGFHPHNTPHRRRSGWRRLNSRPETDTDENGLV